MSDPAIDRPNTIHWPPILYVVVLASAWVLQRWLIPLPAAIGAPLSTLLGAPLLAAGLGIGVVALLQFRADRTPFDPTAPAAALATQGIYRFTRNPMYVGALAAFTGLGLWLQNTWLLLLMPPLALALLLLAIKREEAYLERRFGEPYRAYRTKVRRWI